MSEDLSTLARISPAVWPGKELEAQPGDLSFFTPMGCNIGGPLPVMPWDNLSDAMSRQQYYRYQGRTGHPLQDAPTTDAAGGVVYFDGSPDPADVQAMLRLMRVPTHLRTYAVFAAQSTDVKADRFLTQLRIVSTFALASMFGALSTEEEAKALGEQPLAIGELVEKFIAFEQGRWGAGYSHGLEGCMGGDGDWARETLCFGFLVENGYYGVYRVWSRAWLVTK
jgi:hypothetical protein